MWSRLVYAGVTVLTRYRSGLYRLLAPYLLGVLVLVVLPAALSVALVFTDYDALSALVPGLRES